MEKEPNSLATKMANNLFKSTPETVLVNYIGGKRFIHNNDVFALLPDGSLYKFNKDNWQWECVNIPKPPKA